MITIGAKVKFIRRNTVHVGVVFDIDPKDDSAFIAVVGCRFMFKVHLTQCVLISSVLPALLHREQGMVPSAE